jgi:hypothetical protein
MSISFNSSGHTGSESHHYYRQASAPTASDPLQVGDLWSDTTANLLKRCTSVSPVTFVSVEGGSSAHDLFSSTHGDVDEADTPANDDVLTFDTSSGKWGAEAASGHGDHHSQSHAIDGSDHTGTLSLSKGGTGQSVNPKVQLIVSAASLRGTVTDGAGDTDGLPERREIGTNKRCIDYMAFAANEKAYFQYTMPDGWDTGTVTFWHKWTAASGSGTVIFGLSGVAVGDDDSLDTALGTQVTVTDTLLAADDEHQSPVSGAVTIGGSPAAGKKVLFEIERTGGTLAVEAQLTELVIEFTRNSYTD